jgi:hypothetical protein
MEIREGSFLYLVGSIFGFISAIHLIRAIFSWDVMIGTFSLPVSWSYFSAITLFYLSAVAFTLSGANLSVNRKVKKKNVRKRNR